MIWVVWDNHTSSITAYDNEAAAQRHKSHIDRPAGRSHILAIELYSDYDPGSPIGTDEDVAYRNG